MVLLAAGLNIHSFRLIWHVGTRYYELDQPTVMDYKEKILNELGAKSQYQRFAIRSDLTHSWEHSLLGVRFDLEIFSVWLLEGFFYLLSETIRHLIGQVTQILVIGSWLRFDIINGLNLTHLLTRNWVEMQAASGAP